MDPVTILGMLAGAITTAGLIPQVLFSFRNKSTKDLSMSMLIMMSSGLLLWITYAFMIGNVPVMMTDGASFLINAVLIALKLKHG